MLRRTEDVEVTFGAPREHQGSGAVDENADSRDQHHGDGLRRLRDREAADRLHAPLAEADVVVVGPPGVRVALEVHGEPLVRLELLHERRERGLRGVGQAPLVEAEPHLEGLNQVALGAIRPEPGEPLVHVVGPRARPPGDLARLAEPSLHALESAIDALGLLAEALVELDLLLAHQIPHPIFAGTRGREQRRGRQQDRARHHSSHWPPPLGSTGIDATIARSRGSALQRTRQQAIRAIFGGNDWTSATRGASEVSRFGTGESAG